MKRISFTLLLLALLPALALAGPVDAARAQRAAKTFFDNNGVNATRLTDLSAETGFTNLYIFNAEKGFVVMAADDCVQPILGYSLTGTFVADGMPDNVRGWLQGYDEEIQAAIDSHAKATPEAARQWFDLENGVKSPRATTVVGPLIQTRWNQNKYYNSLCPLVSDGPDGHAFTGCVATAMAQIMKYWEYPAHGMGSHAYTWQGQTLSADFGATTYDWDNMNLYYEYYFDDNGTYHSLSDPSSAQLNAIATLMYHCGVSLDMIYGGQSTNGSSAMTALVCNALEAYFNYSPAMEYKYKRDYEDEWVTMVKEELDAQRPLQYSGRSEGGGHSFICDGYNSDDKFHFNWGWSGNFDGYFSLDNLNTGANNQSGQGNGIYTNDQAALFGIQPVQCDAPEPTGLTYTLSGIQDVTLNWTAVDGAVSYNIYRNNNYVGNASTNSYNEAAPFGTNVYYVRSVDANNNLSLSSNTVSLTIGYLAPVVDDLEALWSGDEVSLTWTAPDWCYPETESAKLNYGEESPYYYWTSVYYAHRHLAEDLAQYAGKAVYKVSTFIQYTGTYSCYVYTKSTQNGKPDPNSLAYNVLGEPVTVSGVWHDFEMSAPIILTGTDDLWVVVKQEDTGQTYPTPSFNLSEHNINAFYAGGSPTALFDANTSFNCAWLINTYLTDGVYTYNLYRDGASIASPLTETSFVDNDLPLGQHSYYVTTNYYAGESEASNTVSFELAQRLVTLDEGWNWWASDVVTSVAELEAVLNEPYQILSQNGLSTGDLVAGQLYKIQTPETVEFPLTGMVADLSSVEVPIGHGINWFGYPGTTFMAITDLVIVPALGDKIISQNGGFAIYGSNGWSGTLNALQPRHGYVYVSTSQEAKTLRFLTDMP